MSNPDQSPASPEPDEYARACAFAREKASVAYVQRKMGTIGFMRAIEYMERMISDGVISTYAGRNLERMVATEAAAMAATVPAGKMALIEAVTKAILFEDTGSTESWEDNLNLGEAAVRVCDARNPPRCSYCHSATGAPVAGQPAEPSPADLKRAPHSTLPIWSECKLRVENSDFIAKRVAEGGYGADHEALLATELHRFIYEYDDTDAYKSEWFRHRLEKLLQETKAAVPPVEPVSAATVKLPLATAMLIRNVFLPANVRKMRSAAPETMQAASEFISAVEASRAAPREIAMADAPTTHSVDLKRLVIALGRRKLNTDQTPQELIHTAANILIEDGLVIEHLKAKATPSPPVADVVREFTNELGNAIRITVEGPRSMHENIVTPMEAEQLRGALNEHAAPPATPDTTTLEAAMRAIEQALSLIGEPQDERMRTVRRVLRGAVVIAEDAAAQPQPQPAQPLTGASQDAVVQALKDAIGVISSINGGHANRMMKNGEAVYWQRKEWIDWARLEVMPTIEAALASITAPSTPTPREVAP